MCTSSQSAIIPTKRRYLNKTVESHLFFWLYFHMFVFAKYDQHVSVINGSRARILALNADPRLAPGYPRYARMRAVCVDRRETTKNSPLPPLMRGHRDSVSAGSLLPLPKLPLLPLGSLQATPCQTRSSYSRSSRSSRSWPWS